MTLVLRYILFGILCATITAAFQPAWYITIIAFWIGLMLGGVVTAAVFWVDDKIVAITRRLEDE